MLEVHLRCVGPRGFTCAVSCVLPAPGSSGEIMEQEQFGLRRELCESMKTGRREAVRPCDKTLHHPSSLLLQLLLLIFSCLRKAAWDYGRLALLMDNDR